MLNIIALTVTLAANTYQVVEADHHTAFAGKLGQRVTQELTLERDGAVLHLHLGRQHTRTMGRIHLFVAGETVEVHGLPASGTFDALPDQVKLVK